MAIKSTLSNARSGFCLALLQRHGNDYAVSWSTYWAVYLISLLYAVLINYIVTDPPRIFYPYALIGQSVVFTVFMFAVYLTSALFCREDHTLRLAVVTSYALLLPYLLGLVADQAWLAKGDETAFKNLASIFFLVWNLVILYRAIGVAHYRNWVRQCIGVITLIGLPAAAIYYFDYIEADLDFDRYWYTESPPEEPRPHHTAEELLQGQYELLQSKLDELKPANDAQLEIYAVVMGTYGFEDVFMREAKYVQKRLDERLGTSGRSLVLINNEQALKEYPLATVSNLRHTLSYLGKHIQKDDIVLLYITSHGAPDGTLSMNLTWQASLEQLNPALLRTLLDDNSILNRVVFVSSCYSGQMIDALKEDNSLIVTASAWDRQSFGCSNDADLTYFAEAFFQQALSETTDLVAAFPIAKKIIEERENREAIKERSLPQISVGSKIAPLLKAYEEKLN